VTGYLLSALTAIMLMGGALGFAFFALHLLDRLDDANDRRKARAQRYRARIGGRY
jgi:hypothetical protein